MGLFVVFEGVDGSGKSTQTRALRDRLSNAGIASTITHEPGGTPTGNRIRTWLKAANDIDPLAELLLFSAARASLVRSVIVPALDRGGVVVCDRYTYSTVAYQGYGRGLELALIQKLNRVATGGGLTPDLVVLIDLPFDKGLTRKAGAQLDRFELERKEFHQRVREGYLKMAGEDTGRWLVIDGTKPTDSITKLVWHRVLEMVNG